MAVDISVPLQGKIALITGSTSGMGLETARVLARNGASIALHGLGDPADIATILDEIGDLGVAARHFGHDLSAHEQGANLVPEVIAAMGRVDILINNAGIQYVADIQDFPDAEWHRLIAVNLTAAFTAIRAAWPGMRDRRWGRIINTASTLAMIAEPRKAAYVSAKHGVLGLTREIALEGAELGITCNAICPGWVLTPLVRRQVEAKAAALGLSFDDTVREHFVRDLPTKRFVETEEIAAAMLFLCSEAARSITGVALPVDGASIVV
ncbi:3-hydroxybutyrate dehydrogenase [Mesorhizobium sp. B2-4-6]|uniref:3-hydroxybutyrate dehydrogenase n=1 Tax=Mesorhizobium sp. B2-4-6 TaxID=2589943 RepID=UPI001129FACB|nr:3-hydroxybutyrate dehydrogenase [Mesorhizobium sp. B2-4-6]TPL43526.1 SDR family oxidoreductase [Mesorhizobium sp. B2-4-6]